MKTTSNGLGADQVNGIYLDSNGTIYAATQAGLSVSKNGGASFTNMTAAQGMSDYDANAVYVTASGRVFVATNSGLVGQP
jgi:ligand-binding sensor domain-containing protein